MARFFFSLPPPTSGYEGGKVEVGVAYKGGEKSVMLAVEVEGIDGMVVAGGCIECGEPTVDGQAGIEAGGMLVADVARAYVLGGGEDADAFCFG